MALHEYDMKKVGLFLLALILFIAAIAGIGGSIYFYTKYQEAQKQMMESLPPDVKSLVEKVGRLMKLPEGEIPTVATVSDLDKLKDQPFFDNAKPGDKVLVYSKAKKAILYDPVADKIVEVGPVNFPTPTIDNQQQLKVALYNGTDISGLTDQVEKDLQGEIENVIVVAREYTEKLNYSKTLVVDLTGENEKIAEDIAENFDAIVSKLPEGEIDPNKATEGKNADILIIIGSDYKTKSSDEITQPTATVSPAPPDSEKNPTLTP